MTKVCDLDAIVSGYFELFIIMADLCNLYTNLGGYIELSYIMR